MRTHWVRPDCRKQSGTALLPAGRGPWMGRVNPSPPANKKGPALRAFFYLGPGDVDEDPMSDSRGREAASEDAKRLSLSPSQ